MLTMREIKPFGYQRPDSWVSLAGPVSLNSRANALQLQEAKALVKDLLYCHIGSFSHPRGKPMAFMSMEGLALSRASIFVLISLFGEMTLRKYLMMQRSNYMRSVSVGREIHLPFKRSGSIGRMVFCLFIV